LVAIQAAQGLDDQPSGAANAAAIAGIRQGDPSLHCGMDDGNAFRPLRRASQS
jgi:hypothetical protein